MGAFIAAVLLSSSLLLGQMLGLVWGNFILCYTAAFIWAATCACQGSDSSSLLSSSTDLLVLHVVSPRDNLFTLSFFLTLLCGVAGWPGSSSVLQTWQALVFQVGHRGRCWNGLYVPERCQWATRTEHIRPLTTRDNWEKLKAVARVRDLQTKT